MSSDRATTFDGCCGEDICITLVELRGLRCRRFDEEPARTTATDADDLDELSHYVCVGAPAAAAHEDVGWIPSLPLRLSAPGTVAVSWDARNGGLSPILEPKKTTTGSSSSSSSVPELEDTDCSDDDEIDAKNADDGRVDHRPPRRVPLHLYLVSRSSRDDVAVSCRLVGSAEAVVALANDDNDDDGGGGVLREVTFARRRDAVRTDDRRSVLLDESLVLRFRVTRTTRTTTAAVEKPPLPPGPPPPSPPSLLPSPRAASTVVTMTTNPPGASVSTYAHLNVYNDDYFDYYNRESSAIVRLDADHAVSDEIVFGNDGVPNADPQRGPTNAAATNDNDNDNNDNNNITEVSVCSVFLGVGAVVRYLVRAAGQCDEDLEGLGGNVGGYRRRFDGTDDTVCSTIATTDSSSLAAVPAVHPYRSGCNTSARRPTTFIDFGDVEMRD